tara:strand:+ start:1032 stop:2132 length:1101 start_codon:yes stop_codon:yes gene_type:complete
MPSINKLLDKINQASQAVKSVKGIKSKLESIGYKGGVNTEEVDKLQAQAEEGRRKLEQRRATLQKSLDSATKSKGKAKRAPSGGHRDLQYPLDGDIDNFMLFTTRLRKKRTSGGNLISDTPVTIALPLPEGGWNQESKVTYKTESIGAFARGVSGAIQGGEDAGGVFEEAVNAGKGFIQNAIGSMGSGVGNLRAGRAVNPMEEQLLEGIDFRTHSFAWDMYPRSEKEAIMVQQIIHAFRVAMLPDTFAAGDGEDSENTTENFFNYPNVFEVEIEGPVSKQIERFLPMVCTGVTVTPLENPDFMLASENDDEFYSGFTKISCEFTEIKVMSQEVYESRVAPEKVQGRLGSISDESGSPSILDSSTGG